MTDLSKLRHFSTAIFSETKSVTPIFFFIFGVSTLSTNSRREMKNANVLKIPDNMLISGFWLKGHSQLEHMRIRYLFIANLHITVHLKKRVSRRK